MQRQHRLVTVREESDHFGFPIVSQLQLQRRGRLRNELLAKVYERRHEEGDVRLGVAARVRALRKQVPHQQRKDAGFADAGRALDEVDTRLLTHPIGDRLLEVATLAPIVRHGQLIEPGQRLLGLVAAAVAAARSALDGGEGCGRNRRQLLPRRGRLGQAHGGGDSNDRLAIVRGKDHLPLLLPLGRAHKVGELEELQAPHSLHVLHVHGGAAGDPRVVRVAEDHVRLLRLFPPLCRVERAHVGARDQKGAEIVWGEHLTILVLAEDGVPTPVLVVLEREPVAAVLAETTALGRALVHPLSLRLGAGMPSNFDEGTSRRVGPRPEFVAGEVQVGVQLCVGGLGPRLRTEDVGYVALKLSSVGPPHGGKDTFISFTRRKVRTQSNKKKPRCPCPVLTLHRRSPRPL